MNKEFIKYEQALELKELGFNEPCFGLYAPPSKTVFLHHYGLLSAKEQILAPLYQQAFRWFREKYNILATVYSNASGYLYEWHDSIGGTHRGWSEYKGPNDGGVWDTYEEAELACLNKLIEIVKKQII
jgi:hypothetical protein